MNKNELCKELAVSGHLPISTAHQAVDGIIRIITEELMRGGEVKLRSLGVISAVDRAERSGRNPSTGEIVAIPAHRSARLRISNELKAALNASSPDNG